MKPHEENPTMAEIRYLYENALGQMATEIQMAYNNPCHSPGIVERLNSKIEEALAHRFGKILPDYQRKYSEHHKMDNDEQVFFYEQDYYVLSNFSAFSIMWKGYRFDTAEHVYHWEKFAESEPGLAGDIYSCKSAHDAFKLAQQAKDLRRQDWDGVKDEIMYHILVAKIARHPYVKKKLLNTGDRQLIEDSWRDDYWGWGSNGNGKNMLGNIWMRIREELLNGTLHV